MNALEQTLLPAISRWQSEQQEVLMWFWNHCWIQVMKLLCLRLILENTEAIRIIMTVWSWRYLRIQRHSSQSLMSLRKSCRQRQRQSSLIRRIIRQVLFIPKRRSRSWQRFLRRNRKNLEQRFIWSQMNHTENLLMTEWKFHISQSIMQIQL